jgi:SET domain-containing protein
MGTRRNSRQSGPRLVRRRSKISGSGVWTLDAITKNTRIVEYTGERISARESARREARQLKKGQIWCFGVTQRTSVDAAVGGNIARFINHACRPNCWWEVVDKTIWIRASRTIQPGEELTYDYSTIGDHTIKCRCRPGCDTWL